MIETSPRFGFLIESVRLAMNDATARHQRASKALRGWRLHFLQRHCVEGKKRLTYMINGRQAFYLRKSLSPLQAAGTALSVVMHHTRFSMGSL